MTFLIALVMGVLAMPASSSSQQVLADYEDNGQIDGCYTLDDFEQALKAIRPDQQQYGAAVDVIRQAELTNIRRPGGACGGTSASAGSSDIPGGTSTGESVAPADPADQAAQQDDGGIPSVVIALIVAGALAIMIAVVYLVVSRRGGSGDDGGPGTA